MINQADCSSPSEGQDKEPEPVTVQRVSDHFRPFYRRHRTVLQLLLFTSAAVGAWMTRFMQDDAFISFRYARNLADGHGIVFNPGERVEGYTNFLWTMLMAIPEALGLSTPGFAQLLGIAILLATVAVVQRLARNVLEDETLAYLATVTLLANMTFLSYATGGLETGLQTLLVMVVATLLLPVSLAMGGRLTARRVAAGAVAGLAILTRIDSVVLIAVIAFVHLWVAAHGAPADRSVPPFHAPPIDAPPIDAPGRWPIVASGAATIGLPLIAVVTPWFAWKQWYYGSLLPNTFVAKTAGNPLSPILFGLFYLGVYFVSYFLFLLVGRWRHRGRLFADLPGLRQLWWVVPVWLLYIVVVGADFMEFRFIVPVMGVLAMLELLLIDRFTTRAGQVVVVGGLLFASLGHLVLPSLGYPVTTFHDLDIWPASTPDSLGSLGRRMGREFPGGPDKPNQVTMAVGSLGALPYYSRLPTIDLVGLTDTYVARHGEFLDVYFPGHLRIAPVDYLVRRNVNLVTAVGESVRTDPRRQTYRMSELLGVYPYVDLRGLPSSAKVVEVPVVAAGATAWLMIYLTPHPDIDALIAKQSWRVYPIDFRCVDRDVPDIVRIFGSRSCKV